MVTMRRMLLVALCLSLLLALPACAGKTPAGPAIPKPKSQLFEEFAWQEDSDNACRLLLPAKWNADGFGINRYYVPANQPDQANISLQVMNFRIQGSRTEGPDPQHVLLIPWEFFKDHPTLDDWTKTMETSNNQRKGQVVSYQYECSLEHARIYSIRPLSGDSISLAAFIVEQNEPLGVMLQVNGAWADIERLKQEGLYDDLLTIAGSVQVIPEQPITGSPTPSAQAK